MAKKVRRQERWLEDDFSSGATSREKEIEQTGGVISMLPPNVRVEIFLQISSSDPVKVFNELWAEGSGRFLTHPEHITVKVTQFRADKVNKGEDKELFHDRKLCATCGRMFKPVHESRAIYCSTSCRGKAHYSKKKKEKENGSQNSSEQE